MPAPKLHLIKPVRDYRLAPLTAEYVRRNAHRGIETVVVPDVNILYAARDVFLRRLSLADSGLDEFRDFIAGCPGLALAPSFALTEVAPDVKAECVAIFDVFLDEFCGVRDHSSAAPLILPDPVQTSSWNTIDALISNPILVLPAYYVTKMHSIWLENLGQHRTAVFRTFLDNVVSDIDILSAVEIEVAAFCFCDEGEKYGSQPGYSNAAKTKIATIRKNFMGEPKRLRTFEGRMRAICNAVRDLGYLHMTRGFQETPVDGVEQDAWIATFDGKLAAVLDHLRFHLAFVGYADRGELNQRYWGEIDGMRERLADRRRAKNLSEVAARARGRNAPRIDRIEERTRANVQRLRNYYGVGSHEPGCR